MTNDVVTTVSSRHIHSGPDDELFSENSFRDGRSNGSREGNEVFRYSTQLQSRWYINHTTLCETQSFGAATFGRAADWCMSRVYRVAQTVRCAHSRKLERLLD